MSQKWLVLPREKPYVILIVLTSVFSSYVAKTVEKNSIVQFWCIWRDRNTYQSARVRQRENGPFRLLDALAGNHGSCIHDHHLEQDICTTVHISSLPRKTNPLFTQDKILVLLTVAIADFFLIDTDEVIRIGKTVKKNYFSLFWRKETRSLLTTHLVLVSFDSQI